LWQSVNGDRSALIERQARMASTAEDRYLIISLRDGKGNGVTRV